MQRRFLLQTYVPCIIFKEQTISDAVSQFYFGTLLRQYQVIFLKHWSIPTTEKVNGPLATGIHDLQVICSTIRATKPPQEQRVDKSHLILHVQRGFLRQTCVTCISHAYKDQTINDVKRESLEKSWKRGCWNIPLGLLAANSVPVLNKSSQGCCKLLNHIVSDVNNLKNIFSELLHVTHSYFRILLRQCQAIFWKHW